MKLVESEIKIEPSKIQIKKWEN